MNIHQFSSREEIVPSYQALLDEEVTTRDQLIARISRRDELDNQLSDDYAWRYINHSRYTDNEEYTKTYMHFVEEITPEWQRMSDQLNRRLVTFPYVETLEGGYMIYLRSVKNDILLFREENISLQEQDKKLATEYSALRAAMTISHDEKELTLQQASVYLEKTDRSVRKEVYEKIMNRQLVDIESTHRILDEMITVREQQAINAGYASYIDYIYPAKGRFDYTPADAAQFRAAIKAYATPLYTKQLIVRKQQLGIDRLLPYDLSVDTLGLPPLRPFATAEELTNKTIKALYRIDPRFGDWIQQLADNDLLDLESRKGKQPGGYNYPMLGQ